MGNIAVRQTIAANQEIVAVPKYQRILKQQLP